MRANVKQSRQPTDRWRDRQAERHEIETDEIDSKRIEADRQAARHTDR